MVDCAAAAMTPPIAERIRFAARAGRVDRRPTRRLRPRSRRWGRGGMPTVPTPPSPSLLTSKCTTTYVNSEHTCGGGILPTPERDDDRPVRPICGVRPKPRPSASRHVAAQIDAHLRPAGRSQRPGGPARWIISLLVGEVPNSRGDLQKADPTLAPIEVQVTEGGTCSRPMVAPGGAWRPSSA